MGVEYIQSPRNSQNRDACYLYTTYIQSHEALEGGHFNAAWYLLRRCTNVGDTEKSYHLFWMLTNWVYVNPTSRAQKMKRPCNSPTKLTISLGGFWMVLGVSHLETCSYSLGKPLSKHH